jgi:hypothetical protein
VFGGVAGDVCVISSRLAVIPPPSRALSLSPLVGHMNAVGVLAVAVAVVIRQAVSTSMYLDFVFHPMAIRLISKHNLYL